MPDGTGLCQCPKLTQDEVIRIIQLQRRSALLRRGRHQVGLLTRRMSMKCLRSNSTTKPLPSTAVAAAADQQPFADIVQPVQLTGGGHQAFRQILLRAGERTASSLR